MEKSASEVEMNGAVFSGRNGLDHMELRVKVLRIPEVMIRVREAQKILEGWGFNQIDVFNLIASDDQVFFRNLKLKSLMAAIVQVGLFDRLVKSQSQPKFLLGNANGDSALLVCSGVQSFEEMINRSQAVAALRADSKSGEAEGQVLKTLEPKENPWAKNPGGAKTVTVLAGLALMTEFHVMKLTDGGQGSGDTQGGPARYECIADGLTDLRKAAFYLYYDEGVRRFINVGPGISLGRDDFGALGDPPTVCSSEDVELLDSIELDPMLGWFWQSLVPQRFAYSH